MAGIRVTIENSAGLPTHRVELPSDVSVGKLLKVLPSRLGLPVTQDDDGMPIVYRLFANDRQVSEEVTLEAVGVRDNDHLILASEKSATGPFIDEAEKERRLLVEDIATAVEARLTVRIRETLTPPDKSVTQGNGLITRPIFGEPSTEPQYQCDIFMVMPFSEEFESIYQDYVRDVVESLRLRIRRGDDFFSHRNIIEDIWSGLANSRCVIADCTGRNANVFYEVGLAHVLGKPTILITQSIEDLPFDLRTRRAIVYKDRSKELRTLQDNLREAIETIFKESSGA